MKRTSGNLAAVISPLDGSIFNDVFFKESFRFFSDLGPEFPRVVFPTFGEQTNSSVRGSLYH
jgi:hypothetical protein